MPSLPTLPKFNMPTIKIDMPKFEMPKFEMPAMPKIDMQIPAMPKFDVPKFDMPKFELPTFDMPMVDVPSTDQVVGFVRDAAYAGTGLVALGAERVAEMQAKVLETAKTIVTESVQRIRDAV